MANLDEIPKNIYRMPNQMLFSLYNIHCNSLIKIFLFLLGADYDFQQEEHMIIACKDERVYCYWLVRNPFQNEEYVEVNL